MGSMFAGGEGIGNEVEMAQEKIQGDKNGKEKKRTKK